MNTRFFVDYKLHNKESDAWAFKTVKHTADYDDAMKAYHSECATYIGSTTFDHVCVVLCDAFGNVLMKQIWNAPVSSAPVTEPEE